MRVVLLILYSSLCVVGLVVALTPSVILNVWPYYTHDQDGMAAVQFILALGAAATPLAMSEFPREWRWAAGFLLVALLWVCIGNGIESSTLMRVDLTSSRDGKAFTIGDWDTQIKEWTTEASGLKASLQKNDQYAPVEEDSLNAAKDRESLACKVSTSINCKEAQRDLKQTARDYELTRRVDHLEQQIEDAKAQRRNLGVAPPDHLKRAAEEAEWLPVNPLSHRPTAIALAAEGWAALGMKIMMTLISSLFVKAFGAKWWEKNESPIRESLSPPQPLRESLSVGLAQVTTKPQNGAKKRSAGLVYAPGVRAWVETVRPNSTLQVRRYAPKQALPHYQEFCKENGYPAAPHETIFGSLLKNETNLTPVAKTGGRSYFEFSIKPKIALLKAAGE